MFDIKHIPDRLGFGTHSRFRENFMKVAGANILAQGLTLLAVPLMSRLYTPEDFGALAIFTASLSLMLSFGTWRYDWSIPNAHSERRAAALLVIGFSILIILSLALLISLLIFGFDNNFWSGFKVLGALLLLLPIAVIGGGLYELLHCWYIRKAELAPVATARILQTIAGLVIGIGGGLFALGPFGLIASSVIASWFGIGLLIRKAENLQLLVMQLTVQKLKTSFLYYFKDSTISSLVALVNALSISIIPIMLAQYYSIKEIGWYALMYRLAVTPLTLITGSLSQSFWAEAASLVLSDKTRLRLLYVKVTRTLCIVSFPACLVCLLGPIYVGPIFGEENWEGAGYVLVALTPVIAGVVIVQPLTHLVVHRKQHWKLCLDVVKLIAIVSVIYVFPKGEGSFFYLVLSLSGIVFVAYIILFVINFLCLREV